MKITESRNEIYKGRYAIEVFVRSLEDGTFNVYGFIRHPVRNPKLQNDLSHVNPFDIVPCEVIVWDPNDREFRANASLSALRMPRRFSLSTRGSGLYGPAQNEQSLELPVAEASGLPYLELVRQGKIANQGKAAESADAGRVEKEPKRNAQKSNRK